MLRTTQHEPRAGYPAGPWPGDRGGHAWPKDREVVTDDGVNVRYTVRGNPDGPWLVFAAGFMCPDNFWTGIAPMLFEQYRCLFVNYRSVGASSDPRPVGWRGMGVRQSDYTIEKFAGDVLAAAEDAGATDVTVIGHSMGCQVALAAWRRSPARVARLVLVAGPPASPLHGFYGTSLAARAFPLLKAGLPLVPRPIAKAVPKVMRLPEALVMRVAQAIRAVGPHAPAHGLAPYLRHFGEVDPAIILAKVGAMHHFDARPWLHEVDVPTLVVTAEDDTFCPPEGARVYEESMPDCETVEIMDASHVALIEYPTIIHDHLTDWLARKR